jgi:hypothetical protein
VGGEVLVEEAEWWQRRWEARHAMCSVGLGKDERIGLGVGAAGRGGWMGTHRDIFLGWRNPTWSPHSSPGAYILHKISKARNANRKKRFVVHWYFSIGTSWYFHRWISSIDIYN